jgi:hypothetical protein
MFGCKPLGFDPSAAVYLIPIGIAFGDEPRKQGNGQMSQVHFEQWGNERCRGTEGETKALITDVWTRTVGF